MEQFLLIIIIATNQLSCLPKANEANNEELFALRLGGSVLFFLFCSGMNADFFFNWPNSGITESIFLIGSFLFYLQKWGFAYF